MNFNATEFFKLADMASSIGAGSHVGDAVGRLLPIGLGGFAGYELGDAFAHGAENGSNGEQLAADTLAPEIGAGAGMMVGSALTPVTGPLGALAGAGVGAGVSGIGSGIDRLRNGPAQEAPKTAEFPALEYFKDAGALGTLAGGLGGAALGGVAGGAIGHVVGEGLPTGLDEPVRHEVPAPEYHNVPAPSFFGPSGHMSAIELNHQLDHDNVIHNQMADDEFKYDQNRFHFDEGYTRDSHAQSGQAVGTLAGAGAGALGGAAIGHQLTKKTAEFPALEYFKESGIGQAALHGLRAGGDALASTAIGAGTGLALPVLGAVEGARTPGASVPARIGNSVLGAGIGTAMALPVALAGVANGVLRGGRHIGQSVAAGMKNLPKPSWHNALT